MNSLDITPIERYEDILLKRDDKFHIDLVNGGKLRQIIRILEEKQQIISDNHNSSISCSFGIHSKYPPAIAKIAEEFGFNFNICTFKTKKSSMLSLAQYYGAKIYGFKVGYQNALDRIARRYFPNDFHINDFVKSQISINANIEQTKNLPELDYLIVTVGSGLNYISIKKGIEKYKKSVKEVIGICIGSDPSKLILNHIPNNNRLIHYYKTYHQKENHDKFDPYYEAKAYEWLMKNIDVKRYGCLLWIIGAPIDFPCQEIKYLSTNKSKSLLEL